MSSNTQLLVDTKAHAHHSLSHRHLAHAVAGYIATYKGSGTA